MYGVFILYVIGASFVLGSDYGLIHGFILIIMVTIWAIFEEKM